MLFIATDYGLLTSRMEIVMRSLLTVCIMAVLPGLVFGQEKRSKGNEIIEVVELKRTEPVSYAKDIEPIFYKKCIACHSGNIKESKLDLASYETLMKGGKRGTPVVPGKAANSL